MANLGGAVGGICSPDRDLRKVGVEDINPDLATFIRTIVVLISFALILFATGQFSHPGPISAKSWTFWCFPGSAPGRRGCAISAR